MFCSLSCSEPQSAVIWIADDRGAVGHWKMKWSFWPKQSHFTLTSRTDVQKYTFCRFQVNRVFFRFSGKPDPNTSNEERLTRNRGSLVCKQNVCWRRSRTELDRLVFQPLAQELFVPVHRINHAMLKYLHEKPLHHRLR